MSAWKGEILGRRLCWPRVPNGPEGSATVELSDGRKVFLRYKEDEAGIWVEFEDTLVGIDSFQDVTDLGFDEGMPVFILHERGGAWSAGPTGFIRLDQERVATRKPTYPSHLKAQMPGKILRVLVEVGTRVERGTPLIVMEAMKMENEIAALTTGVVTEVKVTPGQTVESGADLVVFGEQ